MTYLSRVDLIVNAFFGVLPLFFIVNIVIIGLIGSLIVGLNFAKGLSLSLNIPLIAVSHLEGHLYSSFIDRKQDFPFISLIVSGGHTQILLVEKFEKYHIIANTVDDAAGEAFDKGAKILGLNYPGGPEIEKRIAKNCPTVVPACPRPV